MDCNHHTRLWLHLQNPKRLALCLAARDNSYAVYGLCTSRVVVPLTVLEPTSTVPRGRHSTTSLVPPMHRKPNQCCNRYRQPALVLLVSFPMSRRVITALGGGDDVLSTTASCLKPAHDHAVANFLSLVRNQNKYGI